MKPFPSSTSMPVFTTGPPAKAKEERKTEKAKNSTDNIKVPDILFIPLVFPIIHNHL
jgi:hypothetical protein